MYKHLCLSQSRLSPIVFKICPRVFSRHSLGLYALNLITFGSHFCVNDVSEIVNFGHKIRSVTGKKTMKNSITSNMFRWKRSFHMELFRPAVSRKFSSFIQGDVAASVFRATAVSIRRRVRSDRIITYMTPKTRCCSATSKWPWTNAVFTQSRTSHTAHVYRHCLVTKQHQLQQQHRT